MKEINSWLDNEDLAAENERLRSALKAIADMVVNKETNHAQLSALCMAVAKLALEEEVKP